MFLFIIHKIRLLTIFITKKYFYIKYTIKDIDI